MKQLILAFFVGALVSGCGGGAAKSNGDEIANDSANNSCCVAPGRANR